MHILCTLYLLQTSVGIRTLVLRLTSIGLLFVAHHLIEHLSRSPLVIALGLFKMIVAWLLEKFCEVLVVLTFYILWRLARCFGDTVFNLLIRSDRIILLILLFYNVLDNF